MDSLRTKIVTLLEERPGLTDKEVAHELRNWVTSEQAVAIQCGHLERDGVLKRIKRIGKPAGNYLTETATVETIDFAEEVVPDEVPLEITRNSVHLADLQRVGFLPVGSWTSVQGSPVCTLGELAEKSDVLYAFLIDNTVVCIGHSARSLNHTMGQVQNGTGGGSLDRHTSYLRSLTLRGTRVDVWILCDPGVLQFAGHRISLTAGIFQSLVEHFQPMWNRHEAA